MTDPQESAERVDADKIAGEYPPDRPLGADEGRNDAVTDSYEEREARHRPEDDRRTSPREDEEVVVSTTDPADEQVPDVPEAAEEAALRLRRAEEGDRPV